LPRSSSPTSVRWAAAEGVPETVIAAVLLLDERSVDEIVAELGPGQLEQVIKIVGRSPSCYPPGTLDALKGRMPAPSPEPVSSICASRVNSRRPAGRIKPDAEHMRQAQERRLASLRVCAPQRSTPEPERAVPPVVIGFLSVGASGVPPAWTLLKNLGAIDAIGRPRAINELIFE
jgi:hypothetical protein